MLSSLLNYRLYTDNLAKTLERVESSAAVAREAKYYKDNIGKVSSVDDLLKDQRLYAYALKAYGLEDQIASKAFIRKVLESDLSDTSSFANKLVDVRYRTFASAFDFSAGTTPVAQSASQTGRLIEAYTERGAAGAVAAAAKTTYYEKTVGGVATAQQLVDDPVLFDVALRSVGIGDPALFERSYVRDVIAGDAVPAAGSPFEALQKQFSFKALGVSQTPAQIRDLVYAFNQKTGNGSSPQAAQADIDYFNETVAGGAKPVTALADDPRILRFMLTAVGFEVTSYETGVVASVLASDPSDPGSYLNTMPENNAGAVAAKARFRALRDLFDAAPAIGGVAAVTQGAADGRTLADGFLANYKTKPAGDDRLASNSFQLAIPKIKSLRDLLARETDATSGLETGKRRTLDYVLKAFGLDPETESLTRIRQVLTSDPTDPNSFVSKLKDERYTRLAAAFNFDETGKLRAERLVQSIQNQTQTATLYAASFGANRTDAQKDQVKAETKRFIEAMSGIGTLDQLLADKTVLAYSLKAFGVKNTALSTGELRKILTSDLGDPGSYANTHADKAVAKFAASFGFETDGSVALAGSGVQSGSDRLATERLYVQQMLESEAGEASEGTRLALYFQRKAPEIRNAYSILADKALYQVARTALGLPDSVSQIDIDAQAKILTRRLDFADFADARKLDKFIARFAALHDVNNPDAANASPALQLFGGSGAGGVLGLF